MMDNGCAWLYFEGSTAPESLAEVLSSPEGRAEPSCIPVLMLTALQAVVSKHQHPQKGACIHLACLASGQKPFL